MRSQRTGVRPRRKSRGCRDLGAVVAFSFASSGKIRRGSRELPIGSPNSPERDFTNIDRNFHEFRPLSALPSGTSGEKRSSYNRVATLRTFNYYIRQDDGDTKGGPTSMRRIVAELPQPASGHALKCVLNDAR